MRSFLITLSAVLLSITLNAQLSTTEIDHLMEDCMQKFEVAGAAIGIVKDGAVVYTKGYGVTNIDHPAPVNAQTTFAIGSITKAFTTAALAILVDEGKLSWSDHVVDYLPEFKMYNPYVTEHFTIEDLLTHRSGLGLGAGDLMFLPDGSDFTIHDVLTNFQYFEPVSEFRTQFDYDNLLYFVAGELIHRVSGMRWEKFVQTRVLEPLGMNHSWCSFEQMGSNQNLADPHSTETGEMRVVHHFRMDPEKMNSAPGGILSCTEDMCKWMLLQLNKGNYGEDLEQQLFSERNHRQMWQIHTVTGVNPHSIYHTHFAGYGLGWELGDMAGSLRVSHLGGLPGMLSMLLMLPDINFGVIVLTNTSLGGAGLFSAVAQTLADSYLGLEDNHWPDKYMAQMQYMQSNADSVTVNVWRTVQAADDSHIHPGDYTGTYADKWFGRVEISLRDGQLWFRSLRSPKLNGQMQYYHANAFAIKWEYLDMNGDAFAMFSLDENGKATGMKMKGISPLIDFSFDFQDLDFERVE